ncbi:MAG: beta-lactam-binding protein with PASTA domain, partial [Planctomycetaceae bacterium]
RVQKQTPAPKTAVQNGSVVALTLYMPAIQQTSGDVARPVVLPKVLGAHWKDAEKTLKAAGVVLKFRQGRVATNPGGVFKVYDQKPVAGTTVKEGDTVTLTVFITQELAQKKLAEKK